MTTRQAHNNQTEDSEYIFSRVNIYAPLPAIWLWFWTILTGLREIVETFTGDVSPKIPGLEWQLGYIPGDPMPILRWLLIFGLTVWIVTMAYLRLPKGRAKNHYRGMSMFWWLAFMVGYTMILALFWLQPPVWPF